MSERADGDFLSDIREAMRRIKLYMDAMRLEHFLADIKTQDAIVRSFGDYRRSHQGIIRSTPREIA